VQELFQKGECCPPLFGFALIQSIYHNKHLERIRSEIEKDFDQVIVFENPALIVSLSDFFYRGSWDGLPKLLKLRDQLQDKASEDV
jgi:hypothetical protein